tara:strand:+ start:13921 stop:14823 length:903 start_codon:yes stop_codon:yes gene_type:complete
MKKFIALLLFVPLLTLAAQQDNSWYQVEIIVFQNTNLANMKNEVWPQDPPLPSFRNTVTLSPAASVTDMTNPVDFQLVPQQDFTLNKQATKLASNTDYKILIHMSWMENIPSNGKAIHIFGGTAYDSNGNAIPYPSVTPPQDVQQLPADVMTAQTLSPDVSDDTLAPAASAISDETLSPAASIDASDDTLSPAVSSDADATLSPAASTDDEPMVTATVIPSKWSIDGTLKVSKQQYLILRTNLLFTLPTAELDANNASTFTSFRLKQAIRMRSNELHYLDNPMFSMLIRITPVKMPEEKS